MVALPQRDADDIPFSAARIDVDVFDLFGCGGHDARCMT